MNDLEVKRFHKETEGTVRAVEYLLEQGKAPGRLTAQEMLDLRVIRQQLSTPCDAETLEERAAFALARIQKIRDRVKGNANS